MNTATQNDYRNSLIKLIHVAKREQGLDEPTYRAILKAQGGNESLAAMRLEGMKKVLDYLKAQGFKVRKTKSDRRQAVGPDARKVRALWLFLHELGAVRDPSEAALTAYVQRIAKVDDVAWMRGARTINSGPNPGWKAHQDLVIETLKKWAMRFLPDAISTLKSEVRERHDNGQLDPVQMDCAAIAFQRNLEDSGFDVHRQVWENLRTAAGRPFRT